VATDFTFTTATGGSLSAGVTPGQTATYSLQVAGSTGFSGTVSFACSGGPDKATCAVSPGSASLSGTTPVAVTVKVATAGPASAAGIQTPSAPHSGLPLPLVVSTMAAAVLTMLSNRKLRLRIGAACASLLLLIALNGCGNSKPPEPTTASGTYPLTITATSGNVSHTVNLTLVVVGGR
jgi:hypothetical protein